MKPNQTQMTLEANQRISLSGENQSAAITFDLKSVKMSKEQEAIVMKLFSQNPIAEMVEVGHDADLERGKEGPGSKYLTPAEFEKVRRLGVRLGSESFRGPIIDFCLHVIIVGPRNFEEEIQ